MFSVAHCLLPTTLQNYLQYPFVRLGLCVPSSCSKSEVQRLVNSNLIHFVFLRPVFSYFLTTSIDDHTLDWRDALLMWEIKCLSLIQCLTKVFCSRSILAMIALMSAIALIRRFLKRESNYRLYRSTFTTVISFYQVNHHLHFLSALTLRQISVVSHRQRCQNQQLQETTSDVWTE